MSNPFDIENDPHRRFNPLTQSWVLCSPHRTKRPWQGQQEAPQIDTRPTHDPTCYLCPGNERAGGDHNPHYESTFVFPNDFAAVTSELHSSLPSTNDDLFKLSPVRGECHVICFSPRHDLTMAEMTVDQIRQIVSQWIDCYRTMATKDHIKYVQIFENKGSAMGCSNPHPHGQMWCTDQIPTDPQIELDSLLAYRAKHDRCLLCDYAERELSEKKRVVLENSSFICVVPFWATWPFEVMVLPKQHITSLLDMSTDNADDLADMMRRITCRYDNLFQCSFPYSMGIHQAPVDGHRDAHLHLHFFPPLLRSATVRKFLVGYEMLGEPQRDLTPEQAAERLLAQSDRHYKHASSE